MVLLGAAERADVRRRLKEVMTISYRIDAVRKIIYTTIEGEITNKQLARHSRKIGKDPEIDRSFVELVYVEPTSLARVTSSGIRDSADALRASTPIKRIAIVATQDIDFGLGRMFQLIADESPIEIQIFREQEKAKHWLGIE